MACTFITLEYQTTPGTAAVEKCLADWPFTPQNAGFRSQARCTVSMSMPLQNPAQAQAIPYFGWVVIRISRTRTKVSGAWVYAGGKAFFQGRVFTCAVQASGARAAHNYVFADPWMELEQLCYRQPVRSEVGVDGDGHAVIGNAYPSELALFQGTATLNATAAAVHSGGGGSGYTLGDQLVVLGGTGGAAICVVATLSGDAVATVTVLSGGAYTVAPTNPASTSSTGGSGCTLDITTVMGAEIMKWNTGQQIADVVHWAAAAGIPIQGGISGFDGYAGATTIDVAVNVPIRQCKEIMCGEVIQDAMRTSPDAACFLDYETFPPTLKVVSNKNMAAVAVPYFGKLSGGGWALGNSITPRYDLIPPCVDIHYKQSNSRDGKDYVTYKRDFYPFGTTADTTGEYLSGFLPLGSLTGREEAAVVQTIDVEGVQTTAFSDSIQVFRTADSLWSTSAEGDYLNPGSSGTGAGTFSLYFTNLIDAGTGYSPTTTITVAGGTYTTQAVIYVDTVGAGGKITAWHISVAGSYSVPPGDTITEPSGGAKFDLRWVGSVTASAINLNRLAFWNLKHPQFRGCNTSNAVTGLPSKYHEVIFGPAWIENKAGEDITDTEPYASLKNVLQKGNVAGWMSTPTGTPVVGTEVTVKACVGYMEYDSEGADISHSDPPEFGDITAMKKERRGHEVSCNITLTNGGSGAGAIVADTFAIGGTTFHTYQESYGALSSVVDAEQIPDNLAKYLFDALSILQYDGSYTIKESECTMPVAIGNVLNIIGGPVGWGAARMLVQGITVDLTMGQTVVQVGPAKHLGAGDLIQLFMFNRVRRTWKSLFERNTGERGSSNGGDIGSDTMMENTVAQLRSRSFSKLVTRIAGDGTSTGDGTPGDPWPQIHNTPERITAAAPELAAIPPPVPRTIEPKRILCCDMITGQQMALVAMTTEPFTPAPPA
jgi:hypothetical protein